MVRAQVRVPARAELCKAYRLYPVGVGLTQKRLQAGLPHNCWESCRPEPTGSQRSEWTGMMMYAYLIWPGYKYFVAVSDVDRTRQSADPSADRCQLLGVHAAAQVMTTFQIGVVKFYIILICTTFAATSSGWIPCLSWSTSGMIHEYKYNR